MDNLNETLGLRVVNSTPSNRDHDVNIYSDIKIEFSADINPATLSDNIVVFEDHNKIYKNTESLKDYSKFNVYKGSVSYRDRTLTYTPSKPFATDTCYIIVINDKIKDITGNFMLRKHVFHFYTEKVASYPRVEIISPKYGSIVESMPDFEFKNQLADSYIFQISKLNSFESLITSDIIPGNQFEPTIRYSPKFKPEEGMYYIRIRSENGEWSDTLQIFVKPIIDAVVAEEDISQLMHFDEFIDGLQEPLEILEYFPPEDSVGISTKINLIYLKVRGKVDPDRIKIEDCYVYGTSFDDENESYAHETVDGKWTVVYDSYYDVTYIIFTPVIIDDTEEKEFIETLRSGALIES